MNPLAVRELRVACRSWKLVAFLTAYLLIQCTIFAIWVYAASDAGVYNNPTSIGSGLFTTLSIVLVLTVMLVFPAFSATTIAAEHERKSFDLLLLTPMAPWEIAIGKFFASALQASVFLIATVPLFSLVALFGGVKTEVFLVILWILVLLSILISFVGVFASSLVTKSIPAVLVTYMLAFVLGFILLVLFITVQVLMQFAAQFVPMLAFFADPTLSEGIYFVTLLTLTAAIYCSFLFISTTNRLKPTSHNKSTNTRIFWTCVAVLVPIKLGAYFYFTRLPTYESGSTALLMGALYITLLFMAPSLMSASEPAIASRRVRREMERMPKGLMNAGGALWFPGGARGTAHTAIIIVVGLLGMAAMGWLATNKLEARLEDPIVLFTEYNRLVGSSATATTTDFAAMATIPDPAKLRADIASLYDAEYHGYLMMLFVLGLTLLAVGQLAWRMSLSGLTRGVCAALAVTVLAVWIVLPYIGEWAGKGNPNPAESKIAHFSPVHAVLISARVQGEAKRAELVQSEQMRASHESRASGMQRRWWMYTGATAALALLLLATNLVSHRRVQAKFAMAQDESVVPLGTPQASAEQVQQAIEALQQPTAQPPVPPPPGPPPSGPPA